MRKKLNAILLLILLVLFSCGAGCTDSGRFAVSGKTSTLGLGGEFTTEVTSNINARIGINALDLDFERELDDIEYDIGLDFSSFSALLDWHIFDSPFRISGGVLSMNHKLDLSASATGEQEIGGITYDWSEIGTLSGSVEIDNVAPYVGIGWGNPLTGDQRWGFTCDFGVAFAGSPDVALSATEPVAFADLERERRDIEDELEDFKFYPVISISFFYRF